MKMKINLFSGEYERKAYSSLFSISHHFYFYFPKISPRYNHIAFIVVSDFFACYMTTFLRGSCMTEYSLNIEDLFNLVEGKEAIDVLPLAMLHVEAEKISIVFSRGSHD